METIAQANEEAVGAWNGVLFDRFLQFRHLTSGALGAHGRHAMELFPPPEGARVLDVGCGFGDTCHELAELVGPQGSVVGVDAGERFIQLAESEIGSANISYRIADVQAEGLGEQEYDYAFSRMGIMFFANPVQALRNIHRAMKPGARLVAAVWRKKEENEWVVRAERIVKPYTGEPEEHEDSDELTCGPGPFSMGNADTVTAQMQAAGFRDVGVTRQDIDILVGNDLDEAIALVTALGPAGEALRFAGDKADELRPKIEAELREAYADAVREDGTAWAPASTWAVCATA